MSENVTFRSSLSGFNRADVMEYIKTLMDDNEEKTAKLVSLEEELEKKDALIVSLTEKANRANACENCDLAKQNEVRIGAAMLDAKRFSDLIVCEANEAADNMYDFAFADAECVAELARTLVAGIGESSDEFSASFRELAEKLTQLSDKLGQFCNSISKSKKEFASAFTQEKEKCSADISQTAVPQRKESVPTPSKQIDEDSFAPVFDFLDSVDDLVVKMNSENISNK